MYRPLRPNKPNINGPSRDAINKAFGISGKGPVWVAGLVMNAPQSAVSPSPTPTTTTTPTVTPTPSITPTETPTPTVTTTPTNTPTTSVTPTLTPTNTETPTPTPSSIPSSITYITSTSSTANQSSYTFNIVNIGGPGLIVVTWGFHLQDSASKIFTSATIGGVSATNVIAYGNGNLNYTGVVSARITSGTTANINITMSSQVDNMTISVYRIQNNMSDTVSRTKTTGGGGGNVIGVNLDNALPNTLAVSVISARLNVSPFTWLNATNNFESNIEIGSYSSASTKRIPSGTFPITASVSPRTYQASAIIAAGWI
jgi:hypothetical protein